MVARPGRLVTLAFEDVDGVHPTLPWRPGELTRVLAMVADLAAALTPAPPGLPTLRSFQLGLGLAALDWLRRRTGWP